MVSGGWSSHSDQPQTTAQPRRKGEAKRFFVSPFFCFFFLFHPAKPGGEHALLNTGRGVYNKKNICHLAGKNLVLLRRPCDLPGLDRGLGRSRHALLGQINRAFREDGTGEQKVLCSIFRGTYPDARISYQKRMQGDRGQQSSCDYSSEGSINRGDISSSSRSSDRRGETEPIYHCRTCCM